MGSDSDIRGVDGYGWSINGGSMGMVDIVGLSGVRGAVMRGQVPLRTRDSVNRRRAYFIMPMKRVRAAL